MKSTLGRVSQKWKGRVTGVAAGMCAALASLGISEAQTSATINVINHYDNTQAEYTDYFGNYYSNDQVWLYFLNTGGNVTYTATGGGTQTVSDAVAVQLSAVQNGSFNLAIPQSSTKIYAGFGTSNPFSGTNGPGLYDTNVPYAVAEWTVTGTSYDNLDVSYLDSVSFPTKMTIKNSSNVTTSTTSFPKGTTAASIISALKTKTGMTGPNGPAANMPSEGQIGYGPEVPTVTSQTNPTPERWIGSSKYWISGPGTTPETQNDRGLYTYAPSLNDYLGFLKANAPTTTVGSGQDAQQVTGWFIDYSGNNGYSGFMNVTGNDGNYAMEITNIRVNTNPTAANDWLADPNAGTSITGTISIAANGSTISYNFAAPGDPADYNDVTGLWLDAVIYSAADILGNGDFASGPVITATGDLAAGEQYNSLVPSFMASISASMGTGLLGSDMYLDKYTGQDGSLGSTMYWFNEITREQVLAELFANGTWGNQSGLEYFDVFWGTMADLSGMQGYLSPFSDRYANLSPDVGFFVGDTATWELGLLPIPEPGTGSLLLISALGGAFLMRRGRRVEA